jgi:hypothetical protein
MAYTCKYGNLKTPYRKGRTVRVCKRRPKTKRCAKKSCKYGKLKSSKKGRCCKRKPASLQISGSIHNSVARVHSLHRQLKSVNNRIIKAQASAGTAKTTVAKLEKQIKVAKLEKVKARVQTSLNKSQTSLDNKLSKMAAKGGKHAELVADVRKKMTEKLDKIQKD